MSTVAPIQNASGSGEVFKILSSEEQIRQRLEAERKRLEQEAGIERKEIHHFHKPIELPFTALQRDDTTILFGGLTWKHEKLVHAALEGLGYRCEVRAHAQREGLPARQGVRQQRPVQPDLLHRRQPGAVSCRAWKTKGLTKDEIIDRYVFFTAGACGPCRFGMYEAEYRLALRNAGLRRLPRAAVPAVAAA